MKLRLAKCCYFVNLRSGCFLVAFFDMCMHMVNLSYGKSSTIEAVATIIYLAHFLGIIMLFLSAAVEMSPLLLVYLATDIAKFLFLIISAYVWVPCRRNSMFTLIVTCINILLSVYFWLVTYSYYWQCRETVTDI
ncbi:uncharacterized protein [Drosophila virilis]|uniref:uncharacterized protein isoform X1 n=2 Tax=Drosophila virilis TaxID=7244 RepID=UPI0013960532|nr:uncharacterized protein LOC116652194 isoform X1 [Drosophila virilis]